MTIDLDFDLDHYMAENLFMTHGVLVIHLSLKYLLVVKGLHSGQVKD